MLIDEKFRYIPSKKFRPGHLSWAKFSTLVEKNFKVKFTPYDCELGWKADSPLEGLPDQYFVISSELTFQNAVSAMQNSFRGSKGPPKLTLYLWNPVPQEPIFSRSSRVRDVQRIPVQTNIQPLVEAPQDKDIVESAVEAPLPEQNREPAVRASSGIVFDIATALKTAEDAPITKPTREDDETDFEFDARMAEYVDYMLDLDRIRYVLRMLFQPYILTRYVQNAGGDGQYGLYASFW